jgi:signal transduction histidine kinase
VLEQARPGAEPSREESDPAAAIRSVERLTTRRAAQSEIEIKLELPEGLPPVELGEDSLRQVILNLLLNALEASPPHGRIRVGAWTTAGSVVVEVEDEGAGVPAGLQERIFEPFVTTRRRGSGGLGLAISRRIVVEAGGNLTLLDAPGGGSLFRVELPRPRGSISS